MQTDLFVCINIIIYVKFHTCILMVALSIYNRMRSKYSQVHMINKYWHVIVILAVTHCTINEQPNVRESHFTSVTSGYHELVDNIEEDTVNIADKCHCELTFANYTVSWFLSGVCCIDTLSYTEHADANYSQLDKPITVISLPNTHPPNSQRSLCCHQCIPRSSSTRENRDVYT